MPGPCARNVLSILVLSVIAAAPALAGPTAFLTPVRHSIAKGDALTLRLDRGESAAAAKAVPWSADTLQWVLVRGPRMQRNFDTLTPTKAGDETVTVPTTEEGLTLIAADLKRVTETWRMADLRPLLAQKVYGERPLPDALKGLRDDATVPVERGESSKTLVRVGDAAAQAPSAAAIGKTGQQVEIRLIVDPTQAEVGSDVPMLTYVDGVKGVGVQMIATHVDSGAAQTFIAEDGSGHFRVTAAGRWRVEFHALGAPRAAGEPWRLYTATLSFEVQPRGETR